MRKRSVILSLAIFILLTCIPAGATQYIPDVILNLTIDNPIMEVNGIDLEIDPGRGTKPVIINNRTLVPIRAIIESFGGDVYWNDVDKTATLKVKNNVIILTINEYTAYLNNTECTLDVAPVILNERTMLPIRFIAEGFNLGVAWNDISKTVSIIRNEFENSEYEYLKNNVGTYEDSPYTIVNNNIPLFKDYEIIPASFEYYGELDELGRCNVCMASVAEDIMPDEKRGNISSVKPTGWINKKYDIVSGGYLYNRSHLIGYQLTGENANKRNLITGTRYLNVDGMLPFENMVDDYIEATGNHVMYRVTPVFDSVELVADGVLMEAYSVEDDGKGLSFCVYCYNVQPGITINYLTGDNYLS